MIDPNHPDPVAKIQEILDENAAVLSGKKPQRLSGRRALRAQLASRHVVLRNQEIATGGRGLSKAEIDDYFVLVRGTHPQMGGAR